MPAGLRGRVIFGKGNGMEELIKRLERVIQTGAPDKDGQHPISAETVLEVVKQLSEHSTNLAEVGTDAVSRKAVKELAYSQIRSMYCGVALKEQRETMQRIADNVIGLLAPVTSAQPEIIYCKDCKHFIREDVEEYTPYGYDTHFHAFCDKHWDEEQGEYIDVNLDDFCSYAERREVTT